MKAPSTGMALVTGAARGIGFAIVERLARDGRTVIVSDVDETAAYEAAGHLRDRGHRADALSLDVSSVASWRDGIESVDRRFGPVDVLVNNAGLAYVEPSESAAIEHWDRQIDVMLSGVFYGCQAVAQHMIPRRCGTIVNVASIGGMGGWPQRAAYNAAKAGVINLTQTLASEWGPYGIRVNAVAPGVTRTDIFRKLVAQRVASELDYVRRTPMGRLAEPSEIAAVVAFLAGEASSAITGITLRADGGWVPWANPHPSA